VKVLLIDVDSKIPNLALMKLSAWHKAAGDKVYLNVCDNPDKVYASTIFTRSRKICEYLLKAYPEIEIGGTGWDIEKKLPKAIDDMRPDYSLYNYFDGMEFSTRGCIRNCEFCFVPRKEGKLCQAKRIAEIINKSSKEIMLLDNNFTADPLMIDKCQEIKERDLTVNLCQGVDIRIITDEKAKALTGIRHKERINIAWDLMKYEKQIFEGIDIITQYCSGSKLKCYMLCGFNTTFEEDMYRFEKLRSLKVVPYVMVYNEIPDERLRHFERWVNGFVYYKCKWEEYEPWIKAQEVQGQIDIMEMVGKE
jgi:hypothetical protein